MTSADTHTHTHTYTHAHTHTRTHAHTHTCTHDPLQNVIVPDGGVASFSHQRRREPGRAHWRCRGSQTAACAVCCACRVSRVVSCVRVCVSVTCGLVPFVEGRETLSAEEVGEEAHLRLGRGPAQLATQLQSHLHHIDRVGLATHT
jgi:hypothetical protein